MPINFFAGNCSENCAALQFGICDDQNNTKAYLNVDGSKGWIATVENDDRINVTFIAIDNCIAILKADGRDESRCDGLLNYPNNLVFVELKERKSNGWLNEGIEQLEVTISTFKANYVHTDYRKRRAFVANSLKPKFPYTQQEKMEQFRIATGFRLIIHDTIKI